MARTENDSMNSLLFMKKVISKYEIRTLEQKRIQFNVQCNLLWCILCFHDAFSNFAFRILPFRGQLERPNVPWVWQTDRQTELIVWCQPWKVPRLRRQIMRISYCSYDFLKTDRGSCGDMNGRPRVCVGRFFPPGPVQYLVVIDGPVPLVVVLVSPQRQVHIIFH